VANLICLLVGVLLTLFALGLATRRAFRPLSAASAYRNVAWRLGLDADTRGTSLRGLVDGRRLFVGTMMEVDGDKRSQVHRAIVHLDLPLGLGLHVRPRRRRVTDRLRRRAHLRGLGTGHTDLDALIEVLAADSDRAAALFTDELCVQLLDLFQRWPDSEVTDHWVRVQLRQPITREAALTRLVERLLRLARTLETARRGVPIAPELEDVLPAWRDLAAELGLQLDPHLPELSGTWRQHAVTVRCSRVLDGYRADVRLSFREHTVTGLRLTPQTRPDGFWNVGQDIQVGEPNFDAAFVVKGYDPRAVRQLCTEPACAALLRLSALGEIDVSDHRIELTGVALSSAALRATLTDADAVAAAFGW
jgi:hypothetical protein